MNYLFGIGVLIIILVIAFIKIKEHKAPELTPVENPIELDDELNVKIQKMIMESKRGL